MQKLINWLKGLFIHPKEETTQMTDQVVEVQPVAVTAAVVQQAAPSDADILLAKVKEVLVKLGHNVEPVFDEVVALAKKLV